MAVGIDDAGEQHKKKQFWQKVREQIERTQREDPEGWAEYVKERDLWLGAPSRHRRIVPEWEGLIDFPQQDRLHGSGEAVGMP